jgi:hypothetical protein
MRKIPVIALSLALAFSISADVGAADRKKAKKSGIKGKIIMKDTGEPVEKCNVYAYVGKVETRAAQFGIIGITDWVSHGSAEDGTYQLDLPPGEYYVLARKRASGSNYGPLYNGDWYDHKLVKKAIRIRKGKYQEINFDLRQLHEPMFFQGLTAAEKVTDTGIKGKLLDEDGQHVPGTFVIAFKDDDMMRVPDLASTLTDDEGNYTLYLPKGGRYWLAARFYAMKVPQHDEPFGRYEGSPDHSVEVESGTFLEGIDITLRPYDGDPPDDIMIH